MSAHRSQLHPNQPDRAQLTSQDPATPASPQLIDSRQLLTQGQTTLTIRHAGQHYLLRVTRENKLILTK